MDVWRWLCLANLRVGRKQNNRDAVFGCVFFFVSDTAHSCWITGFNRLLLCSIVFQILCPEFRTCCSLCRLKNLIPKHCIAVSGNKTLLNIHCSTNILDIMSSIISYFFRLLVISVMSHIEFKFIETTAFFKWFITGFVCATLESL